MKPDATHNRADGGGGGERRATRRRQRARRLTRRAVVKMLSVMEQAGDPVQEFLTSGRTGRRNALPDILGEHAATTTADLSHCLQKLTTADLDGRHPSTSGVTCQGAVASTSTAANGSGTASDGASSEVSNMETDISQSGSNVHS
ncbi:uncharacterized protein LOC126334969 isoform X2 [Schistocerca gregaria]|uniref:uncharacterized protein LOC126334969 isoform X2 n=1 Tax=Schistocerca gregaria TaxID=7010 RepID=UPI00211EF645|nr:uncharacterized protein LOC126334969 isoform X2 [Schistocerca gregaria]XP_049853713.1 uncharacterized protein LOC126334969 isoform X2 [Schistocerca gregaria]